MKSAPDPLEEEQEYEADPIKHREERTRRRSRWPNRKHVLEFLNANPLRKVHTKIGNRLVWEHITLEP
jgi:hypothetical protein